MIRKKQPLTEIVIDLNIGVHSEKTNNNTSNINSYTNN